MRFIVVLFLVLGLHAADIVGALKQGRYPDALREADEQLKQQPGNPLLWTLRGMALSNLKKPQESLRSFDKALSLSPKFLPALEGAAETAYAVRDGRAAKLLDRILALQPTDETAHAMAAALSVEAKNCNAAIDHFTKAEHAIANSPLALAQFGACLVDTDRPSDAVPVFEKALSLKSGDLATQYNLALALQLSHQTDKAITILEKLPPESQTLNLLGEAYAEEDKVPEAIAALKKATEIAPADERNYLDLAMLCVDHHATDLALQIAAVGLQNIPKSAKLYALRAAIYAQQGNSVAAAADFEKAGTLEPDQLYGSVGLSLLLRESAKLPEAEAIIRQKLKTAPNDATLNYLLADMLIRGGAEPDLPAFTEAVALLKNSIRLNPAFVNAHAALGKLYMKAGNMAEAVPEIERTLQLAPKDHIALNQLILAYRKLGRNQDAEQAAQQLRTLLADEAKEEVARNRIRLRVAKP